jgi:hypothetical protein
VKRENIIKFTKEEIMPRIIGEKVKKEQIDKNEKKFIDKKLEAKKVVDSKTNSKDDSSKFVIESKNGKTRKQVAKKPRTENSSGKVSTEKSKNAKKSLNVKEKSKKDIYAKSSKKEETIKKTYLNEYYDLPYRYDETIVTILAQTPKRLFVYWDVSDKDKEKYKKAFGEDFFEKTYPVLLVHNEELNYTFEIPINDFANSWYLDIKDSKTKYVVQLGRKFKNIKQAHDVDYRKVQEEHVNLQNDFIYITDSNKLEAPNDHVLIEKLREQITYRNLKTGDEFNKDISNIISKLEETYPNAGIEELYKELYGDEFNKGEFSISNPGSSMPTSGMFGK